MNRRCVKILKVILSKKSVKLKQISDYFNVSYRTVLNDIKAIDAFLYDNFFPPLSKDKKKGVYIDCKTDDKQKLLDLLKTIQPYDYTMSPEERRNRILLHLLKEDSFMTLENLSNLLHVSRTTLFKTLPKVEDWLCEMNLALVRKTRLGISIEGTEDCKRKAVMQLLLLDTDNDNLTKIVKDYSITLGELNPEISYMFEELFDATKLEYLKLLVSNLENALNLKFTDLSYATVIIYIAVVIERIKNGKTSRMDPVKMESMKQMKEFHIVECMCQNLSSYFHIQVTEEEVANLILYILCTNIHNNSNLTFERKDISPLHVLCNNLILEVELAMGHKFTNYDNLFNGLLIHLSPTINRIQYDSQLNDPLEIDIKKNYANLFECVKSACNVLTNYVGKPINDSETAYITLHFCAAIENQFQKKGYKTRAVVVCSSGIGTAKILESRLKSQFENIQVIDTLSYQSYLEKNLMQIDLIISTIILENPSIPCIRVNPLLPEEDCMKINTFLEEHANKQIDKRNTYLCLLDIIDRNCVIQNPIGLRTEIQELLNFEDVSKTDADKTRTEYHLKELLNRDTIRLKASAKTWKEAVKLGADILLKKNFILSGYCEALYNYCERLGPFGPYCVIAPGIAMPHARPTAGVLKTCMSLITLSTPVQFNHTKYDPVEIIIVFASSDGKNHLKALEQLTYLLMDGKTLKQITNTVTPDKLISLIDNV